MSRRATQAALLRAYYAACLEGGQAGPAGVDWADARVQQLRFAALLDHMESAGDTPVSLLDVGCGFGDLLAPAAARLPGVLYTGCDLSEGHIAEARRRHPEAQFWVGDALALLGHRRPGEQGWDYVVACGTFNVRLPAWERWTWQLLDAMWRVTRRGMAFNLLTREIRHPAAVVAVHPEHWLARCRRLSPAAAMRADYLPGDATFYLPRKAGDAPGRRSAIIAHGPCGRQREP